MSNRPKLTRQLVVDYHDYMCRYFDAELIDKKNAIEMIMLSNLLDKMDITDRKTFMKNYAITIPLGVFGRPKIYIPWTPGEGPSNRKIAQIRTLAHECQHVVQSEKDPLFGIKYLMQSSERAHFEALALQTTFELHHWYYGTLPNILRATGGLKNYALTNGDLRVARKHLQIIQKIVGKGGVATAAGKVAIKWLNERTT